MKKSLFAGLTILEPGEGLSTDNGAFIGVDRETIDHLLEIGAKTHRHTGLSGLENPTAPASAGVVASGGTLAAGLGISVGYTLEDSNGGETMLSPVAAVSTQNPLSGPTAAPSGAFNSAAGSLLVNTYFYAVSWTDGEGGETPVGPAVTVERPPSFASGRIILTQLNFGMAAAGAKGWRLYRATGGGTYNLLATGGPATSEFIDDGNQSLDCDTHPRGEEENTTLGVSSLLVTIPSGVQAGTAFINLYASLTGDFSGGSFLGQYPVSSAGHVVAFSTLELSAASPPATNHSIGGAHQIDPETELLNFHWKGPVAGSGSLGSGTLGDVRLTTRDGSLWAVLGASAVNPTQWVRIASGAAAAVTGSAQLWTPIVTTGIKQLSFTSFEKVAGGADEQQVQSAESYTGGCYVTWRISQANRGLGIGLNADPETNAAYTSIDYFLNTNNTGQVIIRENGVEVGTFGTYVAGDTFAITYNGRKVRYWKNGEILREVTRAVGSPLFLDSWWNSEQGGKITEVNFGPMAVAPPAFAASAASGSPGSVVDVEKLTFVGSGNVSVKVAKPNPGEAQVTVTGTGGGAGGVAVFGSGSAVAPAETPGATKIELIGSGGVNVKESSPGGGVAKAVIEGQAATLGDKGVGVMMLKTSEKGAPRPGGFKMVIWYCKEKPTNMAEFDQWIEEGP